MKTLKKRGAKPKADKRIPVTTMIKQSKVDNNGGKSVLAKKIQTLIENEI
jgi:hypothetical protein